MHLVGYWNLESDAEFSMAASHQTKPGEVSGQGWAMWEAAAPNPAGSRALPIVDDAGIPMGRLWGSMFSRQLGKLDSSYYAPVSVRAFTDAALSDTLPWGRWASAAVASDGRMLHLARDPLGIGSMFYRRIGTGIAFSSSIRYLNGVGGVALTPDWEYLTAKLQQAIVPADRTSYAEVRQVKPGAVLTFAESDKTERFLWDPVALASEARPADPELIRTTFEQCVSAWLGDTDRAWVELSGGLDSSAMLWAARQTGRETIAIHFHDNRAAAGDELAYARAASEHLGTELRVVDLIPLESKLETDPGLEAWPEFSIQPFLYSRLIRHQTDLMGADHRILNGVGGDQIFCETLWNRELHDAFRYDRSNFVRRVIATSRWRGAPVPRLLIDVVKQEFARRCGTIARSTVVETRSAPPVSWVRPAPFDDVSEVLRRGDLARLRLPAGKTSHLLAALLDPSGLPSQTLFDDFVQVSPMYSQPLVELALRMKTTDLLAPHNNRIPFRSAMRGKLPGEIIERTQKGETSQWHSRTITRNVTQIAELIKHGAARTADVVDTEGALDALRTTVAGKPTELRSLLRLVALELWHRQLWG